MIAGIVVLSLGDLVVTVAYLKSTGMTEANPIAGWLIRATGSVAVLALYKLLTVGVCAGLLYRVRLHAEGEAAAWCAVLILGLACAHWFHYAHATSDLTPVELARQGPIGGGWVVLD